MTRKKLVAVSPISLGFIEFEHVVNRYFNSEEWRVITDRPKIIMVNSITKQVIPNNNYSIRRTRETFQLRYWPVD